MTFLAGIGARAWTLLAAIGAALAVVGGAFLRGRQAGTEAARLRQAQEAQRQAGERAHVDAEVARTDDPVGELRRDWRRGL